MNSNDNSQLENDAQFEILHELDSHVDFEGDIHSIAKVNFIPSEWGEEHDEIIKKYFNTVSSSFAEDYGAEEDKKVSHFEIQYEEDNTIRIIFYLTGGVLN
jgi:hypothetical protein